MIPMSFKLYFATGAMGLGCIRLMRRTNGHLAGR